MRLLKYLVLLFFSILCACQPRPTAKSPHFASGIIGGEIVHPRNGLARVVVGVVDPLTRTICTGTLLGNGFVLTAAHCLSQDPKKMIIVFSTQLSEKASSRAVDAGVVSPLWSSNQFDQKNGGDIALLHFAGQAPAEYSFISVLPIERTSFLKPGTLTVVAGYGAEDGPSKKGAGILRSVSTRISDKSFSESELLLDQTQGKGACLGDSGGPAFIFVGGVPYLWGVIRGGVNDPENNCQLYAALTVAPLYLPWLTTAAQKILKALSSGGRLNPLDGF